MAFGVVATWTVARAGGQDGTGRDRAGLKKTGAYDLPGSMTRDGGLAVSRGDYGDKWPLTIDRGVLRCEGGAITLEASGTMYALNPEAQQRHLGGALVPVWAPNPKVENARMSISSLIQDGLALC